MRKRDKELESLIEKDNCIGGSCGGFGQGGFGQSGFGQGGFGQPFPGGFGIMGDLSKEHSKIIEGFYDAMGKADGATKEDLQAIDLELNKLAISSGLGYMNNRLEIKKHVAAIAKRYRRSKITSGIIFSLLAAMIIVCKHDKNK